jgi:hypothetical protein
MSTLANHEEIQNRNKKTETLFHLPTIAALMDNAFSTIYKRIQITLVPIKIGACTRIDTVSFSTLLERYRVETDQTTIQWILDTITTHIERRIEQGPEPGTTRVTIN